MPRKKKDARYIHPMASPVKFRNLPMGQVKKAYVTRMFTGLSGNYDLVNSMCSFFIDHYWRIRAVRALGNASQGRILDLCAGTLPLSIGLLKRSSGNIIALDISEGMLRTGLSRRHIRPRKSRLEAMCGDAEFLPFEGQCFDGAMVAFGIRNLSDLDRGLKELSRVMRSRARLVILEFSRPDCRLFATFYRLYLRWVLVPVGGWMTGDRNAFQYLVNSIEAFSTPEEVVSKLQGTGFIDIRRFSLTGGIVSLYCAEKKHEVSAS